MKHEHGYADRSFSCLVLARLPAPLDHFEKFVVKGHRLWIVVFRVRQHDDSACSIDVRPPHPAQHAAPPAGHEREPCHVVDGLGEVRKDLQEVAGLKEALPRILLGEFLREDGNPNDSLRLDAKTQRAAKQLHLHRCRTSCLEDG
ncbi:MAG TPA: hypothetical protein VF376_07605 [Thermoanaerobaculia bacterium]